MDDVWIYQYRFWSAAANEMRVADDAATMDAIRNGLGIPILESGRKVARCQLDPTGRCNPRDARA